MYPGEAIDISPTGTTPGDNLGMMAQKFVSLNDLVELVIENLGIQQQRFIN